ncbi:hypothetical protein [Thalassospira australica]|uniref:hypothetical protein n=1 Tax=Thalassospira australica TaxID=1528106 RepID=UPI00384F3D44
MAAKMQKTSTRSIGHRRLFLNKIWFMDSMMGDHRIGQLSCVREVAFSQVKALCGLIQIKDYSAKKECTLPVQ